MVCIGQFCRGVIGRQNVKVAVIGCLLFYCYFSSVYKPVSKSCAVAKSEQFWRASGQSNLANRMQDCSTGESVVV